jgi:hypothetical protein
MTKTDFAQLIDAYADAKACGNKYLMKKMIVELEAALNELFGESNPEQFDNPLPEEFIAE